MFNKVDVLLVFEHVSRELESLFIIKAELEKKGLSVAIAPMHFDRYYSILSYHPKILVLPYLYSENNKTLKQFRDLYGDDVVCLNLHHEQFYNDDTKHHMLPKDDYSKNVFHLCWSDKFKDDLIQIGVKDIDIEVLGNPRCDSFYMPTLPQLEKIKEGYSKVIFVPTTFSWAFVDENYFLSNDSIDPVEFKKTREITLNAAKSYFIDFYEASSIYPEYLFVLRPHPFEDIEYFLSKFLEFTGLEVLPKNIIITRDYNVYNWMKIADYTVGWCTTVNVESVMAGVPSIIYHPTFYPSKMNLEFYNYFNIVTDKKVLFSILSGEKAYKVDDDVHIFLKRNFGFNGSYVSNALAEWVCSILECERNSINNTELSKIILAKTFFRSIYIDLVKVMALKSGLLGKIFPRYSGLVEDYLSKSDIEIKYKEFKEIYHEM
ncbi:hypothetical protein ACNH6B_13810 [Shewanella basaltis]|uniref:hypothetical protein n=1 Tax=Shewanella basaltis TaxID=472183 RepID=UPI003AAC1964